MSVEREREWRGGSTRLLKQSEQSTYLMCAPACVHARARVCVCVADTLYPIIWSYEMSHCFNFDKMQYPNLPFKYLEVEVDNENIIYPILVRIQEISFGAGVQAQLTGGTYL